MRRFNAPPGWPPPPNVRWRPPRGWSPPESWADPPSGWVFRIDERDRRVLGPVGRYGGPSRVWPVAGIVLIGLLLFGLPQVFGGDGDGEVASDPPTVAGSGERTVPEEATTAPTVTPSPSVSPSPSVQTPTPTPTTTPTSPTAVPSSAPTPVSPSATPSSPAQPTATAPAVYYKNCGAVRAAGKSPLLRGQPGYSLLLDRDGDGIACAHGNR